MFPSEYGLSNKKTVPEYIMHAQAFGLPSGNHGHNKLAVCSSGTRTNWTQQFNPLQTGHTLPIPFYFYVGPYFIKYHILKTIIRGFVVTFLPRSQGNLSRYPLKCALVYRQSINKGEKCVFFYFLWDIEAQT